MGRGCRAGAWTAWKHESPRDLTAPLPLLPRAPVVTPAQVTILVRTTVERVRSTSTPNGSLIIVTTGIQWGNQMDAAARRATEQADWVVLFAVADPRNARCRDPQA